MDQADIRGEVEALYAEAGADPGRPPGALWLAASVMSRVLWIPDLSLPARLCREHAVNDNGRSHRIELRKKLSDTAAQYFTAHELGEYRIERGGWAPSLREWRERAATQIGVGILAPEQAVRSVASINRLCPKSVSISYVSNVFHVSPIIAVLRLGEVLGWPVAVVNREPLLDRSQPYVQLRGEWGRRPSSMELWKLATAPREPHGYRRELLGSGRQFVALLRLAF